MESIATLEKFAKLALLRQNVPKVRDCWQFLAPSTGITEVDKL